MGTRPAEATPGFAGMVDGMAEPAAPDATSREHLLDELAELVAGGGPGPLLQAPVEPGAAAFPEPWAPTPAGVTLLLRRLAWHGGIVREICADDMREAAPPTERKPATRVELVELRTPPHATGETGAGAGAAASALFAIGYIGEDDIAGTLAHEIGVAHAVATRRDEADPYRTVERSVVEVDPDLDLEHGSIATVYLGLGVLAANAAFQQYSRGGRTAYDPLEYDVLRAGYVPMSDLAFLLAVQAVVRGETAPPRGLSPPQRDEVVAWLGALRGKTAALRDRLGIAADARGQARPAVERFADAVLAPAPVPPKNAFRWRTHRGGVGLIAGTVLGVSCAAIVASRGMAPIFAFGGAAAGHIVGRRVPVPRCSACATVLPPDATTCRRCGAVLRGEIESLSQRLEAEEALEDAGAEPPAGS